MRPVVTTYLPTPPPYVESDDVVPVMVSWQRSDPTSATNYLRYFEDRGKLCLDLSLEVPTGAVAALSVLYYPAAAGTVEAADDVADVREHVPVLDLASWPPGRAFTTVDVTVRLSTARTPDSVTVLLADEPTATWACSGPVEFGIARSTSLVAIRLREQAIVDAVPFWLG